MYRSIWRKSRSLVWHFVLHYDTEMTIPTTGAQIGPILYSAERGRVDGSFRAPLGVALWEHFIIFGRL